MTSAPRCGRKSPATPSGSCTCATATPTRPRPRSARGRSAPAPTPVTLRTTRMAADDVKTATTLTELMRRRAALTPDLQYFHLYGETVTYGRVWAQSARYAAGLARAGVGVGDKVCLIYPTCAEFFYTFLGALRLGAVPVPLYPTLC